MRHSAQGRSASVTSRVIGSALLLGSLASGLVTLPSAQALASTSSVPACTGSQLWGGFVGSTRVEGNIVYDIAVINVSHASCQLAGYPRLQGVRGGLGHQLRVTRHGTYVGNLAASVLSPRMSGELILSTPVNCNALILGGPASIQRVAAANTYVDISIDPPGGGVLYVNGMSIDIACGLDVSQLGWSDSLA